MSKRDNLAKVNHGSAITSPVTSKAPVAETPKADLVDTIVENIPEPKTTDKNAFIRQTFYLTYEELEAIATLSYMEDTPKSELLRSLLDEALENRCPGIFDQVKDRAERKRQKKNK